MTEKEKSHAIDVINECLDDNSCPYRLCCECGQPLREGYYYGSESMCCSDECGAKHEGIFLDQFRKDRENVLQDEFEDWEYGYWTEPPC